MKAAKSLNKPHLFPTRLGRYEIVGELGKGAMGVVYRARDPLIERPVAIKTFSCAGLPATEVLAFERRFLREAKSAGGLSHPNIVTVYDVGRSDDLAYIAMELLVGRSLRQILDSGVVPLPEWIADVAAQVADGLAFAHANGVVHRDIKPANIMVLDNDTVKIADFGVALLPAGSNTLSGVVFGSPRYMSPEQVSGKVVDGRSDIFALGAVLYEMLTGRPPFSGADITAILYQVLHAEPPPPSSRRRHLAPGFDRVVTKSLAKSPAERYQSATELAADLRQLGHPATKQPPTSALQSPSQQLGEATVSLPADGGPPPWPAIAASLVRSPRSQALLIGIPVALLLVLIGWRWSRPEMGVAPIVVSVPVAVRPATGPPAKPVKPAEPAEPIPPPAETVAVPPATAMTAGTASAANARLQLAVTPWGEIFVDNQKQGVSPPLREILLSPGLHRIEIRNAGFRRYRETIVLAPRATAKIKHKFE